MPSNVLPLRLKQIFLPIILIFTEGEGYGIKSRLPFRIFFISVFFSKVEKILNGSQDSIPSPSSSVKIQIMGGKYRQNIAGYGQQTFENQKVCWRQPAMFCIITSSKLSRQ